MGVGASCNARPLPGRLPAQSAVRRSTTPECFVLDASGKIKELLTRKEDEDVPDITKFQDLEKLFEHTEEHARTLELVLASTEGSNFELTEKVLELEDQLAAAQNKAVSLQSYAKIIYFKDQHIQRLEAELKTAQEELAMHQLTSKRKIKKLEVDFSHANQEAALTILLLKEKLKTLCEATQAHQEESASKNPTGDVERVCQEDNRHILIQQLSSQVSQQQEKINQLETILESREMKIKQIESECQCKHIVTAEIYLVSKPMGDENITPENEYSVNADITKESEYIMNDALSQESEHSVGAEIPNKFKHSLEANITMESVHSMAVDIKKSENSMDEDNSKESNYIADVDLTQESIYSFDADKYVVDTDSTRDSPYISDAEFTQKSEYKGETKIQQDSEYFVDVAVSQQSLTHQQHENLDGANGDDSNEEFERYLNQISKGTSSHDEKENTTSSTQNLLSNIEGIKQMLMSPTLSEIESPSALDIVSKEEPQNSLNEIFMFASNHTGDEKYVKIEDDDDLSEVSNPTLP